MGSFVRILADENDNLYSAHQVNTGEVPYNSVKNTNLVFDSYTNVIYYKFTDCVYLTAMRNTYTEHLTPYISKNGKFCRFIDNAIVEIG